MSGLLLIELAQRDPEGIARAIDATIYNVSLITIVCLVVIAAIRIIFECKKGKS